MFTLPFIYLLLSGNAWHKTEKQLNKAIQTDNFR